MRFRSEWSSNIQLTADVPLSLSLTLASIEDALNRGGVNYTVYLKVSTVSIEVSSDSDECVRQVLGEEVIAGNFERVSVDAVAEEVQAGINHVGGPGAGPLVQSVRSADFLGKLGKLLDELKRMAAKASRIERFEIKDGHPAYPVFWDFAFIFIFDNEAVVFIGAASE